MSVFSLCDVLTELYKNSKDGQETNPLQMSDREHVNVLVVEYVCI